MLDNKINYFTPHNVIIGLLIFIILLLIFKTDTFADTEILDVSLSKITIDLKESQLILDEIYNLVNDIDLKFDKYKRKPPSSTNKYDQYRAYVNEKCNIISTDIDKLNKIINNIDNYINTYIDPKYSTNSMYKIINNKESKQLIDLLIKIRTHHNLIKQHNSTLIINIKSAVGISISSSGIKTDLSLIKSLFIKELHDKAIIYHKLKGDRLKLINEYTPKAKHYDEKHILISK